MPPRSTLHVVSTLAVAIGVLWILTAVAADALGIGGRPGIGPTQTWLVVGGLAIVAVGLSVPAERRRAVVRAWRSIPLLRPGQCLVVGAWLGLAAGFFEVGHQLIRKGLGALLWVPDEMVWMIPACYMAVFLSAGLLLALLARVVPRVVNIWTVVCPLVFVAGWCQFTIHPTIDTGAAILVAAAVAIHLTRWAAARGDGFTRMARRSLPWMIVVTTVIGIAFPVTRAVSERSATSELPAPSEDAPSVLLIVLDTVRASNLKLHGYERATTPTIDRLAAAGVVFDQARSTAPWTLPSHASMFTGRYGHEHGADFLVPLDDTYPTIAEILSREGYATAGFIGNILYCAHEFGLARGFLHYEDWHVRPDVIAMSSSILQAPAIGRPLGLSFRDEVRNDAPTVTSGFLNWVKEVEDRPFFAFLNYFDAHAYYDPPEPHASMFLPKSQSIRSWSQGTDDYSQAEIEGFVNAYDGCIKYIDDHLAMVVAGLRDLGRLDNTLIVVTSDHGEQFGEHGLMGHSNSLYSPNLHVPLVMSFPERMPAGVRVPETVSLRDLPATILDILDIEPAVELTGASIAPLWRGQLDYASDSPSIALAEVSQRQGALSDEPYSKGDMKSLTVEGNHYILNGDGVEELYDIVADPAERHDLSNTGSGKATLRRLRKVLAGVLAR